MQCTCTLIKSNDYSRTIPELKQLLAIKIVVSVLNSKHFRFIYNPGLKMHRSNLSYDSSATKREGKRRERKGRQSERGRERERKNERTGKIENWQEYLKKELKSFAISFLIHYCYSICGFELYPFEEQINCFWK